MRCVSVISAFMHCLLLLLLLQLRPPKKGSYAIARVCLFVCLYTCLSVCLSVCLLNRSKSYDRILMILVVVMLMQSGS